MEDHQGIVQVIVTSNTPTPGQGCHGARSGLRIPRNVGTVQTPQEAVGPQRQKQKRGCSSSSITIMACYSCRPPQCSQLPSQCIPSATRPFPACGFDGHLVGGGQRCIGPQLSQSLPCPPSPSFVSAANSSTQTISIAAKNRLNSNGARLHPCLRPWHTVIPAFKTHMFFSGLF